jgi:hypothetical protein
MRSLPLVLALAACAGDKGILIYNESPAAGIIEPADGTVFDEGTPIYITGAVQDDAAVEALQIEWLSSIDGVLPDADAPDVDGFVEYSSASFSEGVHIVTLRATDEQGAQGEATVEFEVVDVPDLPSIEVVAPTADDRGLEDFPFIFWVRVSDAADLPEQLTVSLVANPGGFVCEMVPSGSGEAQCAGTLPIGSYVLTFTVMDTEGFTADAVATYIVVSALDYDADGDGVSINGGDCNDSNVTVYPGAPELCDGLDNDCNELTGIDVGSECYDDDGDGYCEVPPCVNTKSSVSDCDDASAVSYPGGTEVANHHDDDCDGTVDEGTEFYDDDGDGYCEAPPSTTTRRAPARCAATASTRTATACSTRRTRRAATRSSTTATAMGSACRARRSVGATPGPTRTRASTPPTATTQTRPQIPHRPGTSRLTVATGRTTSTATDRPRSRCAA